MTIAHYFTFLRIFISPIFLLIYLYPKSFGLEPISLSIVLFILLAISELSDAIDGYIARRFNQVTELGKILDPMADSIYRISLFLTFTQDPVKLPMVLVFVFLYRDSVISTLRTICALKGFTLAARPSGKIKAAIQGLAAAIVILLMFLIAINFISPDQLTSYSTAVVSAAALYTVLSGVDYVVSNWKYIRRLLKIKRA
ncbi:MAG: CDP-alcohol phosphatidyltransferase family protein [Parachlamydiaceae bacterium]